MQTIVLDCDDVVLDWHIAFHDWMRDAGHTVLEPYPADYTMESAHPGKSWDEIRGFIQTFNRSECFGNLPFIDGASHGIRILRKAYPDARIVFLTAVGDSVETHRLRASNLEGIDYDDLIMIPLHTSKRSHLARLGRPGMFVEDHAGHATDGAELGFKSFLIDRPWNAVSVHRDVIRVAGWNGIIEHISNTRLGNVA